jgi:hypothetical protein
MMKWFAILLLLSPSAVGSGSAAPLVTHIAPSALNSGLLTRVQGRRLDDNRREEEAREDAKNNDDRAAQAEGRGRALNTRKREEARSNNDPVDARLKQAETADNRPSDARDNRSVAGDPSTGLGRFRSSEALRAHWEDHGRDFGARTEAEYESQAIRFMNGPKGPETFEKTRIKNGDIMRYNPRTEEFGVRSADGTVRTYFRPDPSVHGYSTNGAYFDAQK